MKVKANYGIGCEKGYFETGETFDIDAKDLPMYGDAVTVLDKAPAGNGGDSPSSSGKAVTEGPSPCSETADTKPSSSGGAVTEGQSPCSASPCSEAADTKPAEEKQAAPKRTTRKRA